MARTQNQQMGDAHEADIAAWIGGALQKGSGNQWHNQGDAKNGEHLVSYPITADGKSTLGKGITITRDMWSKIVAQTFGQNPALFLRFYKESDLRTVWQDLAVVSASLFIQILEDARSWQALQDVVSDDDDNLVPLDALIRLARSGAKAEGIAVSDTCTGCDCCR